MSWRGYLRRRRADLDHAHELQAHLEIETDDNLARGMTPAAARRAAHLKFGSAIGIREQVYETSGFRFLDTLTRDLRYAVRILVRSPSFTIVSVLCLALGIGATTTVFSVVNSVLLRQLGFAHPQGLVRAYTSVRQGRSGRVNTFWFSPPEYLRVRAAASSFQSLDAWVSAAVNLSG